MSFEVVAVRWFCRSCDATAISAPDRLPAEWVEVPPPPWRVQHGPSHACPDHREEAIRISRDQWARYEARSYSVDASEYEQVRGMLRAAMHQLDRLKVSGERTDNPKL